jgi:hypothetical protein
MSLDPLTIWPQRYTLRCERRADLDETLGSLPDHSQGLRIKNSGRQASLGGRVTYKGQRQNTNKSHHYTIIPEMVMYHKD